MFARNLIIVAAASLGAGVFAVAPAQADLLAGWTFETSGPTLPLTDSATSLNATAEDGFFAASSIANGVHTSALTDWSSPAGNGSVRSFSANEWQAGDYWQFTTSTVGFTNISIGWDQARSSTGPATFDLQFSVDGVNFFTLVDDYAVLISAAPPTGPGSWSTTIHRPEFVFAPVAGPASLDDQQTVYFRLVAQVAGSGTAGTNRIDNVMILGDAIPAPGALALLGLAGVVAGRRRR